MVMATLWGDLVGVNLGIASYSSYSFQTLPMRWLQRHTMSVPILIHFECLVWIATVIVITEIPIA